jgi:hypothetical protein
VVLPDYKYVIWLLVSCWLRFFKVLSMPSGIGRSKSLRTELNPKDVIMNIRKTILLSAAAIAFAAPGLSSATSLWYPAKGDSGGEFRADHFESTKTREEVAQAVLTAPKDADSFATNERNRPTKEAAKTGKSKTRAEVQQELLNMSAEEKQRMRELYSGGNR